MHSHNKQLHTLLSQTGMMPSKAMLIHGATKGRTESSRDLTDAEARNLCAYLRTLPNRDAEKAERMRKKMISLAHEMHWHRPGTQKADMQRLNAWCEKYGYLHKPLNTYTTAELPTLVTQFENVYNRFMHNIS